MERINIIDLNRIEIILEDKKRLLDRVLLELDGREYEMSIGRAYFNSLVYVSASRTKDINKIVSDIFLWTTEYKAMGEYKNKLIDYLFNNGIGAFEISRFMGNMVDLELKVVDKGDKFISFDLSYIDIFQLCQREEWIEQMFMEEPQIDETWDYESIYKFRDNQFDRLFNYIKEHQIEPFLSLFSSGIFKQVDFMSCFLSILKRPDPVNGGLLPTLNKSSWARGITDKATYHTELVTSRNAIYIAKKAVAQAGSLSNRMILLVYRSKILKTDDICDSVNALSIYIKDEAFLNRLKGRYKNENGKPVRISKADIGKTVALRSPSTCNCQDGLCKYCVGETYYQDNLSMEGDIIIKMIKDELEALVQKPISAKHSANAKIIAAFLSWALIKFKETDLNSILKIVKGEEVDTLVFNDKLNIEQVYFIEKDTYDREEDEDNTNIISNTLYIKTPDETYPIRINSEFIVDGSSVEAEEGKLVIDNVEDIYHEPFTNIALTDTYRQFERLLAKPSDFASNMLELLSKIDELLYDNNNNVQHVVSEIITRGLLFDKNDDYVDFSKPVSLGEIHINNLIASIRKAKSTAIRSTIGYYSDTVMNKSLLDVDTKVLPSSLDVMFK